MRISIAVAAACAAAMCVCPGAARAAGTDCPPLGHLPAYKPDGPPTLHNYDHYDFGIVTGGENQTVTVAGISCSQTYTIKDGATQLSNLEIMANYRDQLSKIGAQITSTDYDSLFAKLTVNGQETWLSVSGGDYSYDVHVITKAPPKQTLTAPSGADYRLLGHMPNYVGETPNKRNFDHFAFTVQDGDSTRDVDVQGTYFDETYDVKEDAEHATQEEIQANYRNALKALGAQILFTDDSTVVARLERNGQQIWIKVSGGDTGYLVNVVEEKQLTLTIQPPAAGAMKDALDKAGHIALYINFDFDKATLRPDAAPVVAQIVALLKTNPTLKVSLEGHTDNIGGHDYNLKLSKDRAAAVVAAIVKGGTDPKRLSSTGFGPDKPIADNSTAEGRAKNRRVELVKK